MTSMQKTPRLSQRRAAAAVGRTAFGGVDTHKELHVAAVIDEPETLLGLLVAAGPLTSRARP